MDIRSTLFGRRLRLGDFEVTISSNAMAVLGPGGEPCHSSTDRLYNLLGTEEGCRLLGQALRGSSVMAQTAAMKLAEALQIPKPTQTVAFEAEDEVIGRPIDYDADHNKIRAFNLPQLYTRTINEFEGIAAAIVFDRRLDDSEITMLRNWMRTKEEFLDAWPLSELLTKMTRILADGVVTEEERSELFAFLDGLGASAEKCGDAAPIIFDSEVLVTFPKKSFLFTGKLLMCTRAVAEAAVLDRGGILAKSPRSDLDYLVVGDLGTDMWIHSRYGRKIEHVMENKRAGMKTRIIQEECFRKALD